MAAYEYKALEEKYEHFAYPIAVIEVNGVDIANNNYQFVVNHIEVDLSSGYEASIATFHIYNSFDNLGSRFLFDEVKKYILIGSRVMIGLGYANSARQVFLGVITKVNFSYEMDGSPYIKVTAMDVKGIMMANSYAQQLKAKSYGEAVREVLERTAYSKLLDKEVITAIRVTDTPDKGRYNDSEANDFSIEMVNESDYEFVVRAAKKFNYEFFTQCGQVIFRKAKADTEVILQLRPGWGLLDFDVEYDITGLVQEIEARGMDTGKAQVISAKQKFSNKLSEGSRAKALISGSRKVYIDPTIRSKEDAQLRVQSLMEEMSYRFGSLTCTTIGLPEIVPGKFIEIADMGTAISNEFYVSETRHVLSPQGYKTYIKGKAASLKG